MSNDLPLQKFVLSELGGKQAVAIAARRVTGVKVVAEDINVRLPSDREWADGAVVRLSGTVHAPHEQPVAAATASAASSTIGIENHIVVT